MYELGILGLLLFLFILAFLFSPAPAAHLLGLGIIALIFLLTLNGIPLALPSIAIVYAFFITIYYQDHWYKNESNIR